MERTKGRGTRKRGKKRAMQLHLMSFERWIAKECVDSRINSRPFSSFLFHRRCSSTYATRSKLEFLPSISVFRHIRNETKSTGPLIIEIVRDKLSRRGGEERERRKGQRKREIWPEVSIIVVMEPAGFRMYRTYRSFPLGRQ